MKLVTVDSRGRVTLGALATSRYYEVAKWADGTILLTPIAPAHGVESVQTDDPRTALTAGGLAEHLGGTRHG